MNTEGKKIEKFIFIFIFLFSSYILYNPFLKSRNILLEFTSGTVLILALSCAIYIIYFSFFKNFPRAASGTALLLSAASAIFYTKIFFKKLSGSANIYSGKSFVFFGILIILLICFYALRNPKSIVYSSIIISPIIILCTGICALSLIYVKFPQVCEIIPQEKFDPMFFKYVLYILPDIFLCLYFYDNISCQKGTMDFKLFFMSALTLAAFLYAEQAKYLFLFGQNGIVEIIYPDKTAYSLMTFFNARELFSVSNTLAYFIKMSVYSCCLYKSLTFLTQSRKISKKIIFPLCFAILAVLTEFFALCGNFVK